MDVLQKDENWTEVKTDWKDVCKNVILREDAGSTPQSEMEWKRYQSLIDKSVQSGKPKAKP